MRKFCAVLKGVVRLSRVFRRAAPKHENGRDALDGTQDSPIKLAGSSELSLDNIL